jgi:hypothetical protein
VQHENRNSRIENRKKQMLRFAEDDKLEKISRVNGKRVKEMPGGQKNLASEVEWTEGHKQKPRGWLFGGVK